MIVRAGTIQNGFNNRIVTRDRLVDAFAYSSQDGNNMNNMNNTHNIKNIQIESEEIKKLYTEILDTMALKQISDLKIAINNPWSNMKLHIDKIESRHRCKVYGSKNKELHKLTTYKDMYKRIKMHYIDIPTRFDISYDETSNSRIKLMPRYYSNHNNIDLLAIHLMDMYSIRSKTLIALHINTQTKRNGIEIMDQISFSLNVLLHNNSQYLKCFGTSDMSTYRIHDYKEAMIEHLNNAMDEPELRRGIFYSPRQIFDIMNIIHVQGIDSKDFSSKFEMICCNITSGDRLYMPIIQNIFKCPIYCPIYAIPEAIIGYDLHFTGNYTLDPRNAYFEFIKVDRLYFEVQNKGQNKVCSFRNLEIEQLYEIVITSYHTDCIRAMTREIVKIIDYDGYTPILQPVCRKIELIYINLDYNNYRIITTLDLEKVFVDSKINVIDYGFRLDGTTYKFYLESYETIDDYGYKSSILPKLKELINADIEVRIVKAGTFRSIIDLNAIDAIDPYSYRLCRLCRRIKDVDILKNSIVHQF